VTELSRRSRAKRSAAELHPGNLALLAEKAPEAYHDLMAERRHWRRLAWASLIAQLVGNISGLLALSGLGAISWHAIDRGDANQGAAIICTGAVSIVAVFVTGRIKSENSNNSPSGKGEADGAELSRILKPGSWVRKLPLKILLLK
jgi:hypothetical protein